MARSRKKSPFKALAILAGAVGIGTYFSDEIKEKYHSITNSVKK